MELRDPLLRKAGKREAWELAWNWHELIGKQWKYFWKCFLMAFYLQWISPFGNRKAEPCKPTLKYSQAHVTILRFSLGPVSNLSWLTCCSYLNFDFAPWINQLLLPDLETPVVRSLHSHGLKRHNDDSVNFILHPLTQMLLWPQIWRITLERFLCNALAHHE